MTESMKDADPSVMNEALARLVQQDLVEPDEAYMKSIDKEDFVNRLKKLDLPLPTAVQPAT